MNKAQHDVFVFATTKRAYALLWKQRWLHLKAIWPPIVFLVTAEFLYHKIMGNADTVADRWHAVLAAPWYMLLGAPVAWLAGLKFLLSFSISWRRHLLLDEKFDPFFFKKPFWKYLAFLIVTYVWSLLVLAASLLLAATLSPGLSPSDIHWVAVVPPALAILLILWGIIRQVPYFTLLALDPPHQSWRASVAAMRRNVLRYAAAWVMAMVPIMAANFLLDLGISESGVDVSLTVVALGESAFRQAMLFLHFSLGASVGALTTIAVKALDRPTSLP